MLTGAELAQRRTSQISTCDENSVMDLRDVIIDTTQPVIDRMESFINQVKNPYLFKVGDVIIKVEYGDGKNFKDALSDVLCAG